MFKQSLTKSDAYITVEVVRILEGYKVQSTILTPARKMTMLSPNTWAREENATLQALDWARYQG